MLHLLSHLCSCRATYNSHHFQLFARAKVAFTADFILMNGAVILSGPLQFCLVSLLVLGYVVLCLIVSVLFFFCA